MNSISFSFKNNFFIMLSTFIYEHFKRFIIHNHFFSMTNWTYLFRKFSFTMTMWTMCLHSHCSKIRLNCFNCYTFAITMMAFSKFSSFCSSCSTMSTKTFSRNNNIFLNSLINFFQCYFYYYFFRFSFVISSIYISSI